MKLTEKNKKQLKYSEIKGKQNFTEFLERPSVSMTENDVNYLMNLVDIEYELAYDDGNAAGIDEGYDEGFDDGRLVL